MALGLLLQVSCICLILFDGSTALPAVKGYGYPYLPDAHNIGDDADDEVLTSTNFHQSIWQASHNEPSGPVHTSYDKPPAAQQPEPVLYQPLTQSAPEQERLVNGESRDWGFEDPEKQLLFPLNYLPREPVKPQSVPVQPQAPAYQEPAPQSPSSGTWQPEPVGSGYGEATSGYSYVPHLVFEEVFQYPSENTDSSPINEGGPTRANYFYPQAEPAHEEAKPIYPAGTGSHSGGGTLNFGLTNYKPRDDKLTLRLQKMALKIPKFKGPQKVSKPRPPPPPPPRTSYIIQSRNGYQRARYSLAHSKYVPEFHAPMPVMVKTVKRPAPSKAAAPKGTRNPQRAKW